MRKLFYSLLLVIGVLTSYKSVALTLSSTTPDSQGNFTLSWPRPSDGNSVFKVYEYIPGTNTESLIQYVYAPYINLKRPGGQHFFFVVAIGRAPDTRYTEHTVIVPIPKPPKISSFSLSNTGSTYDTDGAIKLNWGSVSHAKRYKIRYRKNGGSFSYKTTSSTSYTLSGLSDGTWEFWVKAENIGANNYIVPGYYSNSQSKKVMKKPGTPPSLKSSESPSLDGTFRLSWGTSSNRVTKYQYQRQYSSGSWSSFYSTGMSRYLDVSKDDGTYTYQVRACNEASCGGKSKITVEVMRRPGVPISLRTSESKSSDGTYRISWSKPANRVTHYKWQVKKNTGSWSGWKDNQLKTYFNRTDSDGKYYFQVIACNELSCSSPASVSTEVIKKPTIPYSLSSTETKSTDGTFTLDWGESSNKVTKYEWRVHTENVGWTDFESTGLTRSLKQEKTDGNYIYQIRACNSLSCSGTRSIEISVLKVPSSPENLAADFNPVVTGKVKISWDAPNSTVSNYKYQYKMVRDTEWSSKVDLGTTKFFEKSLPDNDYVFIVYACNASGCSPAPGIVVTFKQIGAVKNLVVDKPSSLDGKFTLSWSSVYYASSYKWREKKGTLWSDWHSLSGTSKDFSRGDGIYEYEVIACRVGGCGAGNKVQVEVLRTPSTPSGFSSSVNPSEDGNFTLSWNSATGSISHYELSQKFESGTWTDFNSIGKTTSSSQSKSKDGLYYFRVQACNRLSCSPPIQTSLTVDSTLSACKSVPASGSPVDITYSYDALGRLKQVTDSTGCNREYSLDAAGNRMEVRFSN